MTPEQHNKALAWSHIAYGGIFLLFIALMMLFFVGAMVAAIAGSPGGGEAPPLIFFVLVWAFMLAIYAAMTIPSFIAGYGLLKKKKWAKTASIISAVIAAMNFPFGTAVCVYTFWFLFSEPGKIMFEQNNYALPPGRQTWANNTWDYEAQRQRDSQYHPPPPPPDWR